MDLITRLLEASDNCQHPVEVVDFNEDGMKRTYELSIKLVSEEKVDAVIKSEEA